jgi:uncharacterized protein (TIRG00374 family)
MPNAGPPRPRPQSEMGGELLSGWRYRAVAWSVLLAAVGYLGFVLWSGWRDVAIAVAKVGILGVGVVLSLSLVNYGLRFVRWQLYLSAMDHPVPNWHSLQIYLAGFTLTTTPGKAGEALRGVLLKRVGVPYPMSLAALLSERLSDLLAVLLLTLLGLTIYPQARPMVAIGAACVLTVVLMISSRTALNRLAQTAGRTSGAALVLRHSTQVLLQASRCHTPAHIAIATCLSLIAWAAEALAFYLILRWMGIDVPLAFAVFVYAISMLAGALSFMPGGLGGAEAMMISLLVWQSVATPDAVAATVLVRLATLWFAVAVGIVNLFMLRTARASV